MAEILITDAHSRENAHIIGFLANEFPGKDITELSQMFQMPAIDFNVATWRAQDMGFFTVDKKNKVTVHDIPAKWIFTKEVDQLIQAIPYAIAKINEDEADIEENFLTNWCQGYASHEVLAAIKFLVANERLDKYEVESVSVIKASKKGIKKGKQHKEIKDQYTFYTLPANKKHHWGLKQFTDQDRVKVIEK